MNTDILSDLIITRVRSVSTMYSPENKGGKRIDRSCWAIIIKYEGETVYTSSKKQRISNLSHIMLLPKGCSYEWKCTQAGHFLALEFESELTYHEPLAFPVKNGEKILKMVRELEHKRNIRKPMTRIESIRDLYSILITLTHSATAQYLPTQKHQKIEAALDYISLHYSEKITNAKLASLSGISVVYFRKLFVSIMGTSPISYIHDLRIKKAKEMLRSDYGTISDVALSLGYANLYDFSRDFKKHTGVAPSKY